MTNAGAERQSGEALVHSAPDGEKAASATAKLFMHGRSQAVRLPKAFRFSGKEVRIRRFGNGVLLEPLEWDPKAWLARLESYGDELFLPDGVPKAPPPLPENLFD